MEFVITEVANLLKSNIKALQVTKENYHHARLALGNITGTLENVKREVNITLRLMTSNSETKIEEFSRDLRVMESKGYVSSAYSLAGAANTISGIMALAGGEEVDQTENLSAFTEALGEVCGQICHTFSSWITVCIETEKNYTQQ